MFLLPAFLLPFLFVLAIRRLVQIPRKLLSGEWRIPERRRRLLAAADAVAYLLLLGTTVALAAALVYAVAFAPDRLSAYLSLAVYVTIYPLVYLAAAWIFYYGIRPTRS